MFAMVQGYNQARQTPTYVMPDENSKSEASRLNEVDIANEVCITCM